MRDLPITECVVVWLREGDGSTVGHLVAPDEPVELLAGWVRLKPFAWLYPDKGRNSRELFEELTWRVLPAWRVREIEYPATGEGKEQGDGA